MSGQVKVGLISIRELFGIVYTPLVSDVGLGRAVLHCWTKIASSLLLVCDPNIVIRSVITRTYLLADILKNRTT